MNEERLPSDPLNVQVGGDHYRSMVIQPIEFIMANNIPFAEGNCIKYLCRWAKKGGIQDLEKVRHYLDLIISAHQRKENERRAHRPKYAPNNDWPH